MIVSRPASAPGAPPGFGLEPRRHFGGVDGIDRRHVDQQLFSGCGGGNAGLAEHGGADDSGVVEAEDADLRVRHCLLDAVGSHRTPGHQRRHLVAVEVEAVDVMAGLEQAADDRRPHDAGADDGNRCCVVGRHVILPLPL